MVEPADQTYWLKEENFISDHDSKNVNPDQ